MLGWRLKCFADAVRPEKVKLASQPRGISMSSDGGAVAVACQKAVILFVNQKPLVTLNIPFEASCVSLSADGKRIAVGGQVRFSHIPWRSLLRSAIIDAHKRGRHDTGLGENNTWCWYKCALIYTEFLLLKRSFPLLFCKKYSKKVLYVTSGRILSGS